MKLKNLKVGDRFRNKTYGEGVVVDYDDLPEEKKSKNKRDTWIWTKLDCFIDGDKKKWDYLGIGFDVEVELIGSGNDSQVYCCCDKPQFITTGFTTTYTVCKLCKKEELKIGDHFNLEIYGYGHRVPFSEVPIDRRSGYKESDFIWVWLDTYSYDGTDIGNYLGIPGVWEVEPVNGIELIKENNYCNCPVPDFITTGFNSVWVVCRNCKKEKR